MQPMRRSPVSAAIGLTWIACSMAAAGEWPCWRGPDHDGVSRETLGDAPAAALQLQELWRADVGVGFSSFVVSQGRVITSGHAERQDTVVCRNAETGETHWRYSYSASLDDRDFEGGPTATPTIADGRVYVLSREGDVYCLDLMSGELHWKQGVVEATNIRVPGWGFGGSPRALDDLIILTIGESGVVLNRADGSIRWASSDKESGYASPVTFRQNDSKYALLASGRSFSAVDVNTGKQKWQLRWLVSFGCNAADPIVHDQQVFLSSAYNRGCALLKLTEEDPVIVWKHKEMQNQLNGSVLINGRLYGVHGDLEMGGKLRCIDWATGDIVWTDESIRPGSLTATREHLIVLGCDGELIIAEASPNGFDPLARLRVLDGRCWTVPVLSDKRLFCRNAAGSMVCVAVTK